jgi:hypothetical protein
MNIMAIDPPEPEFDWVAAREACSLVKMFVCLRDEVSKDAERVKAIFKGSGRIFEFKQGADEFTVLEGMGPIRTVKFSLDATRTHILIEQDDGNGREHPPIRVSLTLNKEKQCRFKIGDDEFESWQLRKKALERLFFLMPVSGNDGFKAI